MAAVVQVKDVNNASPGGPTQAVVLTSNTTTGNLLIANCLSTQSSAAVTVTGISTVGGSAPFSKVIGFPQGLQDAEIWSAPIYTGGVTPTITVTFSGTPTSCEIVVYEFSGLNGAVLSTGQGSGVLTSISPGGVNVTVSGIMIMVGIVCASVVTAGNGGSWVALAPTTGGNLTQYQLNSSLANWFGNGTQTSAVSNVGVCAGFYSGSIINANAVFNQEQLIANSYGISCALVPVSINNPC